MLFSSIASLLALTAVAASAGPTNERAEIFKHDLTRQLADIAASIPAEGPLPLDAGLVSRLQTLLDTVVLNVAMLTSCPSDFFVNFNKAFGLDRPCPAPPCEPLLFHYQPGKDDYPRLLYKRLKILTNVAIQFNHIVSVTSLTPTEAQHLGIHLYAQVHKSLAVGQLDFYLDTVLVHTPATPDCDANAIQNAFEQAISTATQWIKCFFDSSARLWKALQPAHQLSLYPHLFYSDPLTDGYALVDLQTVLGGLGSFFPELVIKYHCLSLYRDYVEEVCRLAKCLREQNPDITFIYRGEQRNDLLPGYPMLADATQPDHPDTFPLEALAHLSISPHAPPNLGDLPTRLDLGPRQRQLASLTAHLHQLSQCRGAPPVISRPDLTTLYTKLTNIAATFRCIINTFTQSDYYTSMMLEIEFESTLSKVRLDLERCDHYFALLFSQLD